MIPRSTLAAGALVALLPLAFGVWPGDEPTRLSRLLWGYALAGLPYLWIVATWRRWPADQRGLWTLLGLAIGGRLLLLVLPPLLSEDVWRYVWDGAMPWLGVHPYAHAPADPTLDILAADAGLTETRGRIGHAHLPTIYPPASQLVFAACGVASSANASLLLLRLLFVFADAVTIATLWNWAKRLERPPQLTLLYAFLPLAMLESAVGSHVDAIGVAAMVLCGAWLTSARPWRAGIALAVGVGTKLMPLLVVPTLLRRAPRSVAACAVAVVMLWAPYVADGEAFGSGLSAYAHRWRANEGAFAVLAVPFERHWPTGKKPVALGNHETAAVRALVGHTGEGPVERVFPDEVSFAAAKALVMGLLALVWSWLFWRARSFEAFFGPAVVALLLLSPVVHPWYLLWVAPFCALALGRRGTIWPWAILLWALLIWMAYLPRPEYLSTGTWSQPVWHRIAQYGPVWLGLAIAGGRRVFFRG